MSNKTTLQSHNTRIQELINVANSLPDAGNGGSSDSSSLKIGYVTVRSASGANLYSLAIDDVLSSVTLSSITSANVSGSIYQNLLNVLVPSYIFVTGTNAGRVTTARDCTATVLTSGSDYTIIQVTEATDSGGSSGPGAPGGL